MITVKLSKPISVSRTAADGKPETVELSELAFREATVGDLIAGETIGKGSQMASIAGTLASMADIPYAAFKTISAKDFGKINAATVELVGNGEEAGTS